jgi:hypothetical protein
MALDNPGYDFMVLSSYILFIFFLVILYNYSFSSEELFIPLAKKIILTVFVLIGLVGVYIFVLS